MSLVSDLALAARPRYVAVGRRLFAVRRVDTTALRRVGFAALEGSAIARTADARAADARREALAEAAELEGDARADAFEALREREAAAAARRQEAILATAEGDAAYRARLDAYVLAAVVRIAALRLDADVPAGTVLPANAEPDGLAVNLAEPGEPARYSEPITFVRDEAEVDLAAGRVWLHVLTAEERILLGTAIARLQAESVLAEVSCFRDGSATPADAAPDRSGVRAPPARDPGPGAVASGAGGAVRGRRAGGRSRAGQGG